MSELAPTLVIRQMTADDLQAVIRIDQLSFPTPWSRNTFQYELHESLNSCLLIGERAFPTREIVGFLGFWMLMDEAHISTFAVHPDCRRQGIGKRLLEEAFQQAADMGAEIITLEVRESNLTARRLYEKLGFQVVGRRARYYRDNQEDAVVMCLKDLRACLANMDGGGG
jgi:ribosomal-protein-alanine N-acetyltransferase